MSRLTKYEIEGVNIAELGYTPCKDYCKSHDCWDCAIQRVMDKLAHYEDLEEQGRLIELPCKVGDTVYVLVEMNENGKYTRIKADFIESIYQNPDGEWIISFRYIWHDTELFDIGQTVFLTKEEAEAKIEELEGDKE